jgi:hypothetical protein
VSFFGGPGSGPHEKLMWTSERGTKMDEFKTKAQLEDEMDEFKTKAQLEDEIGNLVQEMNSGWPDRRTFSEWHELADSDEDFRRLWKRLSFLQKLSSKCINE